MIVNSVMDIPALLKDVDPEQLREILSDLLSVNFTPVFGAAKSIEHEIAAFKAFQCLGVLSANPDEYELVMKLRVTKAKARSLLYQAALRESTIQEGVDDALRSLLSAPRVTKDGDMVLIEVPQPLLMDFLRHRVRALGFISDGSFSGAVAKVPLPAIAALVADLIPAERRKSVESTLRAHGVPGTGLSDLVSGSLSQFGRKVAGAAGAKAGERIGSKLGDFFGEHLDGVFDWIGEHLSYSESDAEFKFITNL